MMNRMKESSPMKLIKYVPNTLSILRIVLSLALLYLAHIDLRLTFVAVYLFVGATDVFDGKIARRYQVESDLGSKLDAIGDSMLFGAAAISVLFLANLDFAPSALFCFFVLLPGILYKLINVAVTRRRFGQWNMMHTLFNRVVFVSIFFVVPIFMLMREINYLVILGMSLAMCLACLEETITLMRMDEYTVNHNGILGEKLLKKVR